jgi:hypothetical protein
MGTVTNQLRFNWYTRAEGTWVKEAMEHSQTAKEPG